MSVSKNHGKMEILKIKTSTSTRIGHVGEQKPEENGVFEKELLTLERYGHIASKFWTLQREIVPEKLKL